jgi:hypothetical protein
MTSQPRPSNVAPFGSIIREPDDRLADVRVSMGSKRGVGAYLVFRGDPETVIALLENATALAAEIRRGNYEDKRGRPQG